MSDNPERVEGVSKETMEQIKDRVLVKEESMLHYQRPPKIRPDLKEIIEEEITEENIE